VIDPHLQDDALAPVASRTLRQFAALWILFLGGLACWDAFGRDRPGRALVWAGLALAIGPLGLVKPAAIRPVFVGLMAVTAPIGWAVSHVVLGILYYGVFTPVGLFFKLIGRDALARRYRPDLDSYWEPKPAPRDVRSYFHQF
jgi:hypothetical protein